MSEKGDRVDRTVIPAIVDWIVPAMRHLYPDGFKVVALSNDNLRSVKEPNGSYPWRWHEVGQILGAAAAGEGRGG